MTASNRKPFVVQLARWPQDINPIRDVRTEVFIEEQHVAPEEEWDGIDDQCLHVLAYDDEGRAVATGRLLPEGKIGRMAVLREWRGMGVGSEILAALVEEARAHGHHSVKLAAQTHAIPFYEKAGFRRYGDEFIDAGIPHFWMKRDLAPPDAEAQHA